MSLADCEWPVGSFLLLLPRGLPNVAASPLARHQSRRRTCEKLSRQTGLRLRSYATKARSNPHSPLEIFPEAARPTATDGYRPGSRRMVAIVRSRTFSVDSLPLNSVAESRILRSPKDRQ